MEQGDKNTNCVVVKCRIEAKETSGETIHGFYMCVTDMRDIEYDGVLFSRSAIDTEAPLSALYAMLESPKTDGHHENMKTYENSLKDYIRTSKLFQSEKNLYDPKNMEHKITYFCASAISLNVVSFLELTTMSRDELYLAIPPLNHEDKPENGETQCEQEGQPENGETAGSTPLDVVVACDPILDPVVGAPAGDLAVGDTVCCKIKEDSVFFDLMAKKSPDFSGIVSGDITAIRVNEFGSAVVSLKLSDGVAGVLKLAGTVRIKALSRKEQSETAGRKSLLRLDVMLAVTGMAVFLFMMWLLLHILA